MDFNKKAIEMRSPDKVNIFIIHSKNMSKYKQNEMSDVKRF